MQDIQLYIGNDRLELFKDETISLTQSIQNVKDIAKVFTDFTKTFSIPASKSNNKIFKHYYNFDILGGFDARKKTSGSIKLNGVDFKKGNIKLEGVDLKDNKPNAYRVTFFGDLAELKDLIAEDKLSDLNFSEYDLDYNATVVEDKLTTEESSSNHIIAPLITHSQRLFYDSDSNNEEPDDGNLHWHQGGGNHIHGLKWNELKYAIRVNKIIEAIQTKYSLSFSDDFFNTTSIEEFDKLFLWLHRKSGRVEDLSGSSSKIENRINYWTPQVDPPFEIEADGTFTVDAESEWITQFRLEINTVSTQKYDIRVERDDVPIYTKTNQVGNLTLRGDGLNPDFDIDEGYYNVYITTVGAMNFNSVIWRATYNQSPYPVESVVYNTGVFTTSSSFRFNVSKQMPDIKVLDFLTGLFKTFNLTAYYIDDVIQVKPLNDFYSSFDSYDITEYIDVSSKKVDVALPFKEVVFEFKDTKTFLANKYGEIENKSWGEVSYNNNTDNLSGGVYKVQVPFGHILYEKLTDANTGDTESIQYGYSVDKSQNAFLGSPLLFYPKYINTGGISFVDSVTTENVANGHKEITSLNTPLNSLSTLASTNSYQFNFGLEISEWTGDTTFTDTLFSKYYEDYISDVFNPKTRLTKVKAFLPLRILLKYTLADRFIIAGKKYKINSITTNLQTGESDIELLNEV